MILDARELASMEEFKWKREDSIYGMLEAVERAIRDYTNNNFQNRSIRFEAKSEGHMLLGSSPFLRVGDTIQITQSKVNDGLYVVKEILDNAVMVDKELFCVPYNLVTKVEYPPDVREGARNILLWEVQNRQKVGVKSETLSRHSVTYYDLDDSNQVMGYPVSLLGFLKPYMKARF